MENQYTRLEGMGLKFVSGNVEHRLEEGAIGYTIKFKLLLDFEAFKVAANAAIPGYLDSFINAIRPELGGLAYHLWYNYFSDAAGKIHSFERLCEVFSWAGNYFDQWTEGSLARRYAKPTFEVVGNDIFITCGQYFRWSDRKREIVIGDLPVVSFFWGLGLMQGHTRLERAPGHVLTLGYVYEDLVEVDGAPMNRGMLYMRGHQLAFGKISANDIRIAT
ncbi:MULTISPECIES: hypothetical protein [Pseudomonas]|uniref:Uncharacterized protein n=1 Tax=Pseudomonas lini TaxID=163011 RepID=A0A1H2BRD3_9PSED|nr:MULTISPECIES: hypothetical protein [Pseudomonas]KAB0506244.1 hypothetical protein F7R14_09110 [Pseudomonas lini]MDT9677796.1 hypothetical protein [Pseudomonas sp. JV414]SDT60602.1 hypothetical protein SAMN04490191_5493 [Pseudomonas lini]